MSNDSSETNSQLVDIVTMNVCLYLSLENFQVLGNLEFLVLTPRKTFRLLHNFKSYFPL